MGLYVVTLSGFSPGNPLRKLGHHNLWIDSRSYGLVELAHNFLIHLINDTLFGKIEYSVRN